MAKGIFKVSISPQEVENLIEKKLKYEFIDSSRYCIGDNKYILTLIYEKYFFRNNSKAAIIIIIDNMDGYTKVKSVGAAAGAGALNINWGAENELVEDVEKILSEYQIR
ncbi:hypothetical protein JCM1393_07780 [Clostridium carnis]